MKQNNKKLGLIFLLVGIGLILGAIGSHFYTQSFRERAVEATAQITRIDAQGSDENRTHDVYIRFTTAQGTQIDTTLGYYSSGMELGDSVTVLYDPEDPVKVLSGAGQTLLVWVCSGMGLIFAGMGIRIIIPKKQKAEL